MIQIDDILLPDGLIWADEYSGDVAVQHTVRRRLDGGIAVYPRQHTSGREITLVASEDHWLTRAQADALKTKAAIPGGVFSLQIRGQIFGVMFRHHDPPALDLEPLITFSDAHQGDPLTGDIKLIAI